jgi:hypothetical protein
MGLLLSIYATPWKGETNLLHQRLDGNLAATQKLKLLFISAIHTLVDGLHMPFGVKDHMADIYYRTENQSVDEACIWMFITMHSLFSKADIQSHQTLVRPIQSLVSVTNIGSSATTIGDLQDPGEVRLFGR